jgi:hypothetical protein
MNEFPRSLTNNGKSDSACSQCHPCRALCDLGRTSHKGNFCTTQEWRSPVMMGLLAWSSPANRKHDVSYRGTSRPSWVSFVSAGQKGAFTGQGSNPSLSYAWRRGGKTKLKLKAKRFFLGSDTVGVRQWNGTWTQLLMTGSFPERRKWKRWWRSCTTNTIHFLPLRKIRYIGRLQNSMIQKHTSKISLSCLRLLNLWTVIQGCV